jgi:hypothetical protein
VLNRTRTTGEKTGVERNHADFPILPGVFLGSAVTAAVFHGHFHVEANIFGQRGNNVFRVDNVHRFGGDDVRGTNDPTFFPANVNGFAAGRWCFLTTRLLMLRMMSVTSSTTPGMVVISWATPSILTRVTALPSRLESNTRRRLFPMVTAKPGSKGSQ